MNLLIQENEIKDQVKFLKEVKSLFAAKHKNHFIDISNSTFLFKLYINCKTLFNNIIRPSFYLNRKFKTIITKYPLEKSEYICVIGESGRCLKKSNFSEARNLFVNDRNVKIPIGAEDFLSEFYGDYLSYLPIENRFSEFFNGLNYLRATNKGTNP